MSFPWKIPFATSGDQTALPDSTTDGTVSATAGYGPDYELPVTDPNAKKIERRIFNTILNAITAAIRTIWTQGIPDFIAAADNGNQPFAYQINAVTRFNNIVWRSLTNGNTATPGVDVNTAGDHVNYWLDMTAANPPTAGGTGQTSYQFGDLLYGSGANTLGKLAAPVAAARKFFFGVGNGTVSTQIGYDRIQQADIDGVVPTNKGGAGVNVTIGGVTSGGTVGIMKSDGAGNVLAAVPATDFVAPGPAKAAGVVVQESFGIACSDETTQLTTGTAKATFRMPYGLTPTSVKASATTAPSGAAIQVDIKKNGASILATKLSIDAGTRTSVGSGTPFVFVTPAPVFAADDEVTVDILQIGSANAGTGLKVEIIGNQ